MPHEHFCASLWAQSPDPFLYLSPQKWVGGDLSVALRSQSWSQPGDRRQGRADLTQVQALNVGVHAHLLGNSNHTGGPVKGALSPLMTRALEPCYSACSGPGQPGYQGTIGQHTEFVGWKNATMRNSWYQKYLVPDHHTGATRNARHTHTSFRGRRGRPSTLGAPPLHLSTWGPRAFLLPLPLSLFCTPSPHPSVCLFLFRWFPHFCTQSGQVWELGGGQPAGGVGTHPHKRTSGRPQDKY